MYPDPVYRETVKLILRYLSDGKIVLPTTPMNHIYELIKEKRVPDLWRDWSYLGGTWYSPTIDWIITSLKKQGIIENTCTDDGRFCGLIKLSDKFAENTRRNIERLVTFQN